MSDDNVLTFKGINIHGIHESLSEDIPPELSHREKLIAFLRELADDIEQAPEGMRTAIAFFAEDPEGITVHCGGFTDDQAAIRYLSAFIRNQGFAA